jgi:hypothetical protein
MKKIALWAIPRAVGTAFERVFLERDDTTVAHELFMPCHYYSQARVSSRYDGVVDPEPEHEYEAVEQKLEQLASTPILFLKEIAFHMEGIVDPDYWAGFTHTFIIRDPAVSIPSLYKLMPDASFEETGFGGIAAMFELATRTFRREPIVVNGDEFRRNPSATLKSYCELADIPFDDTTTWKTGKVLPEWQQWRSWHQEALNSSGINEPPAKPAEPDLPEHVVDMIEKARPYYEEINRHAIDVRPDAGTASGRPA